MPSPRCGNRRWSRSTRAGWTACWKCCLVKLCGRPVHAIRSYGEMPMNPAELHRWQWQGYTKYHASRLNLLIHIVAVPGFLAGNVLLVLALAQGQWAGALGSLLLMAVSFGVQGIGHGK